MHTGVIGPRITTPNRPLLFVAPAVDESENASAKITAARHILHMMPE